MSSITNATQGDNMTQPLHKTDPLKQQKRSRTNPGSPDRHTTTNNPAN